MATKRDLFLAQGGKCFFCGRYMKAFPWDVTNPNGYTRDHFYPKSRKVLIPQRENAVLSCQECNTKKGDKQPTLAQERKFIYLHRLVNLV